MTVQVSNDLSATEGVIKSNELAVAIIPTEFWPKRRAKRVGRKRVNYRTALGWKKGEEKNREKEGGPRLVYREIIKARCCCCCCPP